MKQHIESLARTSILLVAGGLFAMIGLLLLANAGALAIARAIESLIGGYLIVGAVIASAGVIRDQRGQVPARQTVIGTHTSDR